MAFVIKYRLEFTDRKGTDWKAEILEDGFSGSVTALKAWGTNPLVLISRATNVKFKHSPIMNSRVELTVVSETDYDLMEFGYGSSKQYLVNVYKGFTIGAIQMFSGYILKGLGNEAYTNPPYPVKLIATDFISSLKDIKYVPITNGVAGVHKCSSVLLQILNVGIGISKDVLDSSDLFNNQDSPGANDVAMDSTMVSERVFTLLELSYYEVLEELMKTHGCRFYQQQGTAGEVFWVVDNLELHKTGTDITYKKRSKTDYSYIADLVVSHPALLHTDLTVKSTPKISFIEAAREINVNSELVKPSNLLNGTGLDSFPGASIITWTEIGGGKMASGTNSKGYASENSYQFSSFKGIKHLGIGSGLTKSLYVSSLSGKKHDITIVAFIGSGIYQLTFTNEFVSPPVWVVASGSKLYIENRGVFEITTSAAGGSGTSTIRIRVIDESSIPKVDDRIIGDIDFLNVLELGVGFEFFGTHNPFKREESIILILELVYANQWYEVSALQESRDDGLNFIGLKFGGASGDTFNGQVWGNLADNTAGNSFSQIIEFPETKHEQFETFKIEIPLDWDGSLSDNEILTIALINSYSKGMIYKSITLKIDGIENFEYNLLNVSNNDTDLKVESPLFKVTLREDNAEFGSVGGLITSNGSEIELFGSTTPKIKNVLLADFLKLEYGENVQIWKGNIDAFLFGHEIIKDNKNFGRIFQIQESTVNLNLGTTSITAVEIRPSGEGAVISLIEADSSDLYFDPHLAANTTTENVEITNNGNTSITVGGTSSGSHFTVSANQVIPAYETKTFVITSTADTLDNYTETVTFVDTLGDTNAPEIICSASVVLIETAPFNFKLLTHFPITLAERYDFDEPQLYDTIIVIEQIDTPHPDMEINASPVGDWKSTLRTQDTFIWNLYNETADQEGLFTGSYQFFDQATDNAIDVDTEINVITGLRMAQNPEVSGIIQNRVRIDGGSWIDIVPGVNNYINFLEGEEFDWNLETSGDLEDIQMAVHLHGSQGTLLTFVGTAVDFSHTLTFIPFVLAGDSVSVEISIQDVS